MKHLSTIGKQNIMLYRPAPAHKDVPLLGDLSDIIGSFGPKVADDACETVGGKGKRVYPCL